MNYIKILSKRNLLSLLCIFFVLFQLSAQQIKTHLAPGIDKTNNEFMEVYEVWKNYLASNPNKIYDNPYWNESEKAAYKSYDLLNSHGFLSPSLYSFDLSNVVLYIKKEQDFYVIVSQYYWLSEGEMYPLAITKVIAKKDTFGNYKLHNWLPYYTKDWKTKKVGVIIYHYPLTYKLNIEDAEKANTFVKNLTSIFDLKEQKINYYITEDCDHIFRLQGFEFIISMGTSPKCAFFDKQNNIVYTIEASGALHKHELIHLINNRYPNANPILLSGLSVYTDNENSSLGKPFLYHIKKIQQRIVSSPAIDLSNWWDMKNIDNITEPLYFIGAILCDIILEQGGIGLLKDALNSGTSDENLLNFFDTCLGLSKEELNIKLKARFDEISKMEKMNFLIKY